MVGVGICILKLRKYVIDLEITIFPVRMAFRYGSKHCVHRILTYIIVVLLVKYMLLPVVEVSQ